VVTTHEVTYTSDGITMRAHLARPEGAGPWPTVLIGHDGIGLESYQRRRADLLAERGYLTLAMDYHGGRCYFDEPQAMLDRVLPLIADPERMATIGREALDALLAVPGADPGRMAALGYGAGGSIVLELARTGVPFRGVALVHPGLATAVAQEWVGPSGPFLLCTGSADPLCTPEQALEFGRVLQEAGADWRVDVYGGAEHAFWAAPRDPGHADATVPGVGYHPTHATRAWRAVLDLLDEALGNEPAAE
jgi:dienelactone hydrolase